jgi:Na+-transporting NADH:ubiquinone oxidoreductase subunit B
MRFLRQILDAQGKYFHKGGPLEKAYPLYEAMDTFLYTPGRVTRGAAHVRDGLDLKRMMMTVVIALLPCVYMAMYNTGYQAHLAISQGATPLDNWQTAAMQALGMAFDPANLWACIFHGALYYLPVVIVTMLVGGNCEALFAVGAPQQTGEGHLCDQPGAAVVRKPESLDVEPESARIFSPLVGRAILK